MPWNTKNAFFASLGLGRLLNSEEIAQGVINEAQDAINVAVKGTAVGAPSPISAQTVQGVAYQARVTSTRPSDTTAYAAGDAVGSTGGSAIQAFDGIGPAGGFIFITAADLRIHVSSVPSGMGNQRLHLFGAIPTAIADNAAWVLPAADRASYLGFIDIGTPADLGDTLFVQADGINKPIKLAAASTTLYGILQTIAAYTPTSAAVSVITLNAVAV